MWISPRRSIIHWGAPLAPISGIGAAGGHDHAVLDPRIAGRVSSLPSSVLVPEQGFREGRVRGWPAGQEGLPEQLGVVRPGHPESEGEGSGHDGSQGYTGWPFAGTQP